MSELDQIGREARALHDRGVGYLLATVVRVTGSSYRRPGARMLVAEDRWLSGSVSGGCLERDILVRGAFRTRKGEAALVRYDADGGLGCEGVVEVLLQPFDPRRPGGLDPLAFARQCFDEEDDGVLVTVFESEGAVPLGPHLAIRGGTGEVLSSGAPFPPLLQAARDGLHPEAPRARVVALGGVAALVERLRPLPHLVIVGTRHDAVALLEVGLAAGLRVTVADVSLTAATRGRFSAAHALFAGSAEGLRSLVDAKGRAAVVLMTHDFPRDRAFLGALLGSRAAYLGVLGARARTERLLEELGVPVAESFRRIYGPAGLDLGAETPREIALSIVAEAQGVLAAATRRPLRDRRGPIHGAAECTSLAGEIR